MPLANDVATAVTPVADRAGTLIAPALKPMTPMVEAATPLVNAAAPAVGPVVAATESVIQPVLAVTGPAVAPALGAAGSVLDLADPLLTSLPGELTDPVVAGDLPAVPGSFAQAATGNAVSAVRDAAGVTTTVVQGATDTADEVLPVAPVATASRVVARAQTSLVDPPTLPLPIVAPQATSATEQAAADAAGVLTKVVPVQVTGSRKRAATDAPTLPTRLLPTPDVDTRAAETTESADHGAGGATDGAAAHRRPARRPRTVGRAAYRTAADRRSGDVGGHAGGEEAGRARAAYPGCRRPDGQGGCPARSVRCSLRPGGGPTPSARARTGSTAASCAARSTRASRRS